MSVKSHDARSTVHCGGNLKTHKVSTHYHDSLVPDAMIVMETDCVSEKNVPEDDSGHATVSVTAEDLSGESGELVVKLLDQTAKKFMEETKPADQCGL